MKEFQYVIKDAQGIHARPAGELIKAAKGFASTVKISANGKTGDCKKIFTVMALGVKQGMEVTISCEGTDEDAAAEAMRSFFENNL